MSAALLCPDARRAPFLVRARAVLALLLLLSAATFGAAEPRRPDGSRKSMPINSTPVLVHVAPNAGGGAYETGGGAHLHGCGATKGTACTLAAALLHSPPFATLRLAPGVYTGAHRVTKSFFLQGGGANGDVVFDGRHQDRPLWFDGVPARMEGLVFINGFGSGAGCALVTMPHDDPVQSNYIRHCSFANCTASGSGPTNGRAVAGALAIVYGRSSTRHLELNSSSFDDNYGRGAEAAGALMVRFGARTCCHRPRRGSPTFPVPSTQGPSWWNPRRTTQAQRPGGAHAPSTRLTAP